MKLLISLKGIEEARRLNLSKIDILDIKNPEEGALGANFPEIIKGIVKISHENNKLCSAAIGDLNKAGTASLAALGVATLKVDYIKVGLLTDDIKEAIKILKNVVNSIKNFTNFYGEKIKVVAVGYADWMRANTIPVEELPEIALLCNADVVMIDTYIKDGKILFDFLSENQLTNFVNIAKTLNLQTALAGSLKKEHIKILKRIEPDIIGFMGAVRENFNREGEIKENLIEEIYNLINE